MFNPKEPYNNLPKLPPNINFRDPDILDLVVKARTQLAELKGYSFSLPNPTLLLSPAIIKESIASSQVENIHTTMIQALENQIYNEEERRAPDKEVLRYRDAVLWGFNNLKDLNLSTRLILGVQDILLPNRDSGYRHQQNALENKETEEIIYIPPTQIKISECMQSLENFLNSNPQDMDPLIACIIGHYQFEAIHPFSDGNGRTGRILMVLQLVKLDILNLPVLYISKYINNNKSEYYRHLLEVTTEGKWVDYIKFMLKGFTIQASDTKDLIVKIMSLFWQTKDEIKNNNRGIYSADLIEAIFSFPVISPVKLAGFLKCHYTTATRYLDALKKINIMSDKKVGKYHLYINNKLLDLLHNS
ncbi:MAG: Fic family protein [Candidatus Shapirobacteria bacterium]|nr:Fic family protein [Candidatus Shapirobacteria bacterium]